MLPLFLIFILPALGVTSNGLFALLLFACFFMHLFMIGRGPNGGKGGKDDGHDIKRFGLAWGVVGALLYLGCALIMMTAGKGSVVFFFNSLFHGLDVAPILRTEMPFWEMILGVLESFVFGWLVGAAIASIYNASLRMGRRA